MSLFRRPSHRLRTRGSSRWLILVTLTILHGVRMTTGSRDLIHTSSTGTTNTLGAQDTATARKFGDVEG